MNKQEATDLQNEILTACTNLVQKDMKLLPPDTSKIESHGYQLQIRSNDIKDSLQSIRAIAQRKNLAIADESQKGLITIYRPCFIHYSNQNLK